MFTYTGGSFSETDKVTTTEPIKIGFIKSFAPNKHLIAYYEDLSNKNYFYCGISVDTFPFSKAKLANSSYFADDSVKPNTVDGVKYYSLNDVPSFSDITKAVKLSDGTYDSNVNCTGDKLFVYVGSVRNCLDACPADRPFKEAESGNTMCRNSCYAGRSAVYGGSNICVAGTCAANSLKYYGDSTNNVCTTECIDDYLYLDGDICKNKCEQFMKPTFDKFKATEKGECLSTCDSNTKYQIEEATLVYADSTTKKYCLDSCSTAPYTQYKLDGSINRCVSECQSGEFLDLQSISNTFTLSTIDDTNKECIVTCNGYKFQSTTQFASLSFKTYCLPVCPPNYFKEELGTNNNNCLEKCSLSNTNKYTSGQNCLAVCDWSSTPFVDEVGDEKHCLASCPSDKNNVRTEGSIKYCIAGCQEGALIRFRESNYLENRLNQLTDDAECTESCTEIRLEGSLLLEGSEKTFCLDECPIGMYSIEESSNNKYCLRQCDSNSFFNFSTPDFRCVQSCSGAGFKFTTEAFECIDECSFLVDQDNKCVSECPKQRPFQHNNHCLATCPFEKQFISSFNQCVDSCPNRFHDKHCVDTCGEERLVQFYSDNLIPLDTKPFTLSTRECAAECSETNAKLIDEDSLDCLEECPDKGNIYKTPDNYCRKACSSLEYPFRDQQTNECLGKCKEERPFMVPNEKACLSKCPVSAQLVFRKSVCTPDVCEQDCEEVRVECLAACPSEAPFKLERDSFWECVCKCPEGFAANSQHTCELICSAELGFTRDEDGKCFHCFGDKGGLYLEGTECVERCSPGHFASVRGACMKCKAVGMWENEKGKCIQEEQCDRFSQKNLQLKTCYKCNGEGLKLVIEEGKDPLCTQSECSGGHVEKEKEIVFCFICSLGRFYSERSCLENCPQEKAYDIVEYTCTNACSSGCSETCCINGRCSFGTCQCEEGFTGAMCNIPIKDNLQITERIVEFAHKRLSKRLLISNEINLLEDLSLTFESSRKLVRSVFEIRNFLTNALHFAKEWYIKHSFQINLFELLDKLLGLALKVDNVLEETTYVQSVTQLIDLFSDNMFTSEGESLNFEVTEKGHIKGKYYELIFASDINSQSEVALGNCLNHLIFYKTPFKLVKFSKDISNSITRKDRLALLISETPLIEVSAFHKGIKIDLNLNCRPSDIDIEFEPELNSNQLILIEKFEATSVNVFDPNDEFFVDRCVPFSEDGQDITLSERKRFQIDKKELCSEHAFNICEVKQTDNGKIICSCKGIRNQAKSTLEGVITSYPDTNYVLFTCASVFLKASILENKGLLVVGLPFLLGILMAFIYSLRINGDLQNKRKFNYLRQDCTLFDPSSMNMRAYFTEANKLSTLKLKQRDLNITYENKNYLPTIGDLKHLSAEELLLFDLRSNWQFALDTLVELHPIGNIFFKNSLRLAPTFQIMTFVTETNLTTMASAFFIEDSMVVVKNEEGSPSLFDSVTSQLVQTIWAILTSMTIMTLVRIFIKVDLDRKNRLVNQILKDKLYHPRRVYDYYSTKYRKDLLLFLFICICFNLVFIYFVVIYLELYSNSQVIWLNGIIMSIGIRHLGLKMILPCSLIVSRILVRRWSSTIPVFKLVLRLYSLVSEKE